MVFFCSTLSALWDEKELQEEETHRHRGLQLSFPESPRLARGAAVPINSTEWLSGPR